MKPLSLLSSLLLPICFSGCADMTAPDQGRILEETDMAAPAEVWAEAKSADAASAGSAIPRSNLALQNFAPDLKAASVSAVEEGTDNRFEAQPGRKVSYAVTLAMSVDDLAGTLRKIEAMVRESGGYVQESNDNGGVLRIPIAKAEALLAKIEACGSVNSRSIVSSDATAQIVDAEIRLENLRKMRTRLLALLEKAGKVEDALKVERELNRVVTDIERFESQLAWMNNLVDYVTLTLRLNQTRPVVFVPRLPIPWMGALGSGEEELPRPNGCAELPFELEIPGGLAVIASVRTNEFRQLWAASADDCVLRLTRRPGLEGADLDFWRQLARRSLSDVNRFTELKEEAVTLPDGTEAATFEAKRGSDGYWLCLMYPRNFCCFIPGDREVCLIEFWGPASAFGERLEAVKAAVQSFEF